MHAQRHVGMTSDPAMITLRMTIECVAYRVCEENKLGYFRLTETSVCTSALSWSV